MFACGIRYRQQEANKPRYGFLVYSVSVHHWWVARPFLRADARRFAVASFTKIVDALEANSDPDAQWRCRNALALALCHDECKTADKALATMTLALGLAKQARVVNTSGRGMKSFPSQTQDNA